MTIVHGFPDPVNVNLQAMDSGKLLVVEGSPRTPALPLHANNNYTGITSVAVDLGSTSQTTLGSTPATPTPAPPRLLDLPDSITIGRTLVAPLTTAPCTERQLAAVTIKVRDMRFFPMDRDSCCCKLFDFVLLHHNSVSFHNEKQEETLKSKWSRAITRAAKIGNGLLKDENAQKLTSQHWLEAIDPFHRYGHNLRYYYDRWLKCKTDQAFFHWLDSGEGKELNLDDKCSRSKLRSQCITYLCPKERQDYEVVIEDGKFLYKKSEQILDTPCGPRDAKWIFVLSPSKTLYVAQKKKGTFHHSSFLSGGATSVAGRLVVQNGNLKAISPHSGHYRPTEENFQNFKSFLKENMVDLTNVKMSLAEEDDEFWGYLIELCHRGFFSFGGYLAAVVLLWRMLCRRGSSV